MCFAGVGLKSCHKIDLTHFLYCFLKYFLSYFSRIQKPSHPYQHSWRWRYRITHCCSGTWKYYKVLPWGAQLSWCQSFKLWWNFYPIDFSSTVWKAQCGQVLYWSCTRWVKSVWERAESYLDKKSGVCKMHSRQSRYKVGKVGSNLWSLFLSLEGQSKAK